MQRLLHQLHYQRQLEPVFGLDVEREPRPVEFEPAHLEGIVLSDFAQYAVEQHDGLRKKYSRFSKPSLKYTQLTMRLRAV